MGRQRTSRKNATSACAECAKSKRKCVFDPSSSKCLECGKKNKECFPQDPTGKKRGPKTKKSVSELIKHVMSKLESTPELIKHVMSNLESTPPNELNLIEENLNLNIKLLQEVEHTPNAPIQPPTVNSNNPTSNIETDVCHTVSYPPTNNEIPGTCTNSFQGNYSTESSDYTQYDFPFNTPYTAIFFDDLDN
ncbi:13025_t:CDS:2, partial [Gigaspora rosea]